MGRSKSVLPNAFEVPTSLPPYSKLIMNDLLTVFLNANGGILNVIDNTAGLRPQPIRARPLRL
jgi:hypothetical protein